MVVVIVIVFLLTEKILSSSFSMTPMPPATTGRAHR